MTEEIKQVSESFSMQPCSFRIGQNMGTYTNPEIIDCIKFEIRPNNADVYVGYTENGEKLFQWIVKATNVQFI